MYICKVNKSGKTNRCYSEDFRRGLSLDLNHRRVDRDVIFQTT